MTLRNSMILIPTLNPDDNLVDYIVSLISNGFNYIVVVNDGSLESKEYIFDKIRAYNECKVIDHAVNLGKGRALKNGFNHCLNFHGNDAGIKHVITVDSDGQHKVEDVIRVDEFSNSLSEESLVLGCRDFSLTSIPFKSKSGNKITRSIFRLLYGAKISDTQTGLRSIPKSKLDAYMRLAGEGFEYETNMLVYNSIKKSPIEEISIQTVYYDNNSLSHFNPVNDSIAIYKIIINSFLKFVFASLSSAIIDLGAFQLMILLLSGLVGNQRILIATIIARSISSLYNYTVNRKIVFKNKNNIRITIVKYYLLCIILMLLSAFSVSFIYKISGLPEAIIKMFVDAFLFLISFKIQQIYIFGVTKGERFE